MSSLFGCSRDPASTTSTASPVARASRVLRALGARRIPRLLRDVGIASSAAAFGVSAFVVVAGASALGAGCSSSSSSPVGGVGGDAGEPTTPADDAGIEAAENVTLEQSCDAYAAAWCERSVACQEPRLKKRYADVDACKAGQRAECLWRTSAPGTGMTPAIRNTCAIELSALACDDVVDGMVPPSCAVAGTLAASASCVDDAQCAAGFCAVAAGEFCGKCAAAPGAAAKCVEGRCGPGLLCDRADSICRTLMGLGETCGKTTPCRPSLSCTGGKCVARAAQGAACDDAGETAPLCDAARGLECGPSGAAKPTCTPFRYVAPGASCVDNGEVLYCTAGSACTPSENGDEFTCVPAGVTGAECIDSTYCVAPLVCRAGACATADVAVCK